MLASIAEVQPDFASLCKYNASSPNYIAQRAQKKGATPPGSSSPPAFTPLVKAAIEREESQACLSYPEREQFRASLKVRLVTELLTPSLNRWSSEHRAMLA